MIKEKLFAWFQLLRLPNLFTVPGDVLAGYLLAGVAAQNTDYDSKSLLFCMCASVCIYCAGLLQNDYCDREKDARFRPERPIPAGQVSASSVLGVAMVLFLLGLLFSGAVGPLPFMVCGAMAGSVISYNGLTKRIALLGAMNMGLCRGLNLLLGASVPGPAGVNSEIILVPAGFLTLYVGTLTLMAYDEHKPNELGMWRWLLAFIMIGWFVSLTIVAVLPINAGIVCLFGGWALVVAAAQTAKVGNRPDAKKLQRFIGEMVRALILIQATMVCIASPLFAGILLLAWLLSTLFSKKFYSS